MNADFGQVLLAALAAGGGTTLGASVVFLFHRVNARLYSLILSFCAGIMMFAVIEMFTQSHGLAGHRVAFMGLLAGLAVFMVLDWILPHAHMVLSGVELSSGRHKAALLISAMTLHNIPEGFAIAAAFATSSDLGWLVTMSIALQDIPEGLVISAPIASSGSTVRTSFYWGLFSGLVESVAAIVGFLFLRAVMSITPWALAFAAGTMTYVACFELLPDALKPEHRRAGLLAFVIGFGLAYGLSVLLGFC
ncbi:MAG: ZIP family metal transporter [Planctomycetota bacterium]